MKFTLIKDVEVSSLLDFYGDILTQKQLEAALCYYNEDLSLSEIASNQGISRQGVRDAIKRAEVQLFYMENKLRLAVKFRSLMDGLEKIKAKTLRIRSINKNLLFSKEIQDCTEVIEKTILELSE